MNACQRLKTYDSRCARGDSDDCCSVHSSSGVRTAVTTSSTSGHACNRACGTHCNYAGTCKDTSLHSRATFSLDSLGLGDGDGNGDGENGGTVGFKTKSGINALGDDEVEGAEVGA